MNIIAKISLTIASVASLAACEQKKDSSFKYLADEFADISIIRFKVPGWEDLSLQQKEYVYHLSEAAKYGRDITWDQYCAYNLPIRHTLEDILNKYKGSRDCAEFQDFLVYAKRVFFSNGVHHHYAEDKFVPSCPKEYFASLMEAVGAGDAALLDFIYDANVLPQRRSTSQTGDIVALSAVNFYDGVTRAEVEKFYEEMNDPKDPRPISYGLNSKVVKENGELKEVKWCVGSIYGPALEKISEELRKAQAVAENESQKKALGLLIDYYRTGDLHIWDEYNIEWLQDSLGTIDYINGFIEDYDDPLGRKATWEGYVNIKDVEASARTEKMSANAQWFEDNSPVASEFKKKSVKGVSAKVINGVTLAGATYPATPIGINLPNANWIRKEYGSKSVTIANISQAYGLAADESPNSVLSEFAWDEAEIARAKKFSSICGEIHTDLHECLGHGSGQLLPGVSSAALAEYSSTLEETRADLFGLYYIADPKLVELGILDDPEAYKAEYDKYVRNGLFTQFTRIELGKKNTEAHMQNRKLIAEWCYEKGREANVIEKKVRDGKSYFVINDYVALRALFAELLAEIQRIKSEGDYKAGKAMVEKYAIDIDYDLHKEVLDRYAKLNLKPYGGFINPDIVPVEKNGKIVDYVLEYPDDFLAQHLEYGVKYRTL